MKDKVGKSSQRESIQSNNHSSKQWVLKREIQDNDNQEVSPEPTSLGFLDEIIF